MKRDANKIKLFINFLLIGCLINCISLLQWLGFDELLDACFKHQIDVWNFQHISGNVCDESDTPYQPKSFWRTFQECHHPRNENIFSQNASHYYDWTHASMPSIEWWYKNGVLLWIPYKVVGDTISMTKYPMMKKTH